MEGVLVFQLEAIGRHLKGSEEAGDMMTYYEPSIYSLLHSGDLSSGGCCQALADFF